MTYGVKKFDLDSNLLKRSCEGQCLNGGRCTVTSNGTKCSCVKGFFGDRCENDGICLYLLIYLNKERYLVKPFFTGYLFDMRNSLCNIIYCITALCYGIYGSILNSIYFKHLIWLLFCLLF